MELTNLVVNQTARNIMQQFGTDIEKAHQVGDEHPNGKWVWTQLPSGKFDWRVKKNSGASAEGGSNKNEKKEEKQPASQKDERFSEDGIVGKDGGFNKQGKTYKRWAALREKVESGKATSEEKKEFANLHNQYLNEKDRHAYEQSKQTDPKAKEPKYKTVDERRAEYKGKKEEGKEKEKTVSPAAKKLIADQECNYAVFVGNAQTHMAISCSTKLSHMLADGISEDSPAYKSALVNEVMSKMHDSDFTAIAKAVKKYGADAVKEAMIAEKGNTVKESVGSDKTIADTGMIPEVADAMILEAQRRDDANKKKVQESKITNGNSANLSDMYDSPNRDKIVTYLRDIETMKAAESWMERLSNEGVRKNNKRYTFWKSLYDKHETSADWLRKQLSNEVPQNISAATAGVVAKVFDAVARRGNISGKFDPSKVTVRTFKYEHIGGHVQQYVGFLYDGKEVGMSDPSWYLNKKDVEDAGFKFEESEKVEKSI